MKEVNRAKATFTWAKASPRAVAKAKNKASQHVVVPTRTTKRTEINPGETAILHQVGQTLSPLVGSKIRGPGPVPKHRLKRCKNKEPSLAMKMGTIRVPQTLPLDADGAKTSQEGF